MSRWTVLFSAIPASGTRQIDKTFIKGLLTIQDQEHFKTHNKRKLRQQYRKSRFSGDKTAPLAVRFHHAWALHIGCFREFPKSARIGNWFLVLLGCPFGRYDLGTTIMKRRTPLFSNACACTLAILHLPMTLCHLVLLHLRVYQDIVGLFSYCRNWPMTSYLFTYFNDISLGWNRKSPTLQVSPDKDEKLSRDKRDSLS